MTKGRKPRLRPATVKAEFFLAPRRENYEHFLAIMVDRDELPQTFEEWERNIGPKAADLKAQGIILRPVMFDAEEFVASCLARNLPCGDEARAAFAAEAARRIVAREERERGGSS